MKELTETVAAVVLAAGKGTRFKSTRPKVLHEVAGWPLLRHVCAAARSARCDPIVVVGPPDNDLGAALDRDAVVVPQPPGGYGTAFATEAARPALEGRAETVVVLYGDSPLVTPETLAGLVSRRQDTGAAVVVAWADLTDPAAYGRVLLDPRGDVTAIVEEAEATQEQRALTTVNSGFMAFDGAWLWSRIGQVVPSRINGERYLPALVAIAIFEGRAVAGYRLQDPDDMLGCDDAARLASAEAIMQRRLRNDLFSAGVQLRDPATTYLHRGVSIGPDCVLLPNTSLEGSTRLGRGVTVGPNSRLIDADVGDGCVIDSSRVVESRLGARVTVGPFANIRAGCLIGDGCTIGSHAELKATELGDGVQVHHFGYLGDAEVGPRTNIGAGTITCNFDGTAKHRTVIGADVLIGSDTLLVAPVTLADRAVTGAGSVVTHDVPAGAVAYGVPARVRGARPRE